MVKLTLLILVLAFAISAALCKSTEEDDSESSEENQDIITLFRPVPVSANDIASDEDSLESDEDSDESDEELAFESEIEASNLRREKRGLGRRLKKLRKRIGRGFRKVKDSVLPAAGAALGSKLVSGAAAALPGR